jgi:DNA polymerase-3 subunit epsilon/oligoribonuclease
VIDQYQRVVKINKTQFRRAQEGALRCNGFTFQELQTKGVSIDIVQEEVEQWFLKNGINRWNSKFIAQNCSFDRAFFFELIDEVRQREMKLPYHWLDFPSMNLALTLRDEEQIDPMKIPFSKDYIAEANGLAPEEKPHRAMNGVKHLLLLYQNIVQ